MLTVVINAFVQQEEMVTVYVYIYNDVHIHSYSGLRVWGCHIRHNDMVGCFTKQKGDR